MGSLRNGGNLFAWHLLFLATEVTESKVYHILKISSKVFIHSVFMLRKAFDATF
jgi:hypothetical protein